MITNDEQVKKYTRKRFLSSKHKDGKDLEVEGFEDAKWATSSLDTRSTSGYYSLERNLVIWISKKKNVLASSSVEDEHKAKQKFLRNYFGCCLRSLVFLSHLL